MALSHKYDTPLFCVLHENPSTDAGKTRGHLGSELNRKAFANLRIDKDAETLISTIYGLDMRKREIPKEHGFCFAWNDVARMHTFKGMAVGIKKAKQIDKKTEKYQIDFEKIFKKAFETATNPICPDLNHVEAAAIHRDINGTKKPITPGTMKKRMQRAESLGVLRKNDVGRWAINLPGQLGQKLDNL
jgi:hypothetical protein